MNAGMWDRSRLIGLDMLKVLDKNLIRSPDHRHHGTIKSSGLANQIENYGCSVVVLLNSRYHQSTTTVITPTTASAKLAFLGLKPVEIQDR